MTLDPDTEQIVRRRMRERDMTFEEALDDAIRSGARAPGEPFRTPTVSLCRSEANLDRALQVAGAE